MIIPWTTYPRWDDLENPLTTMVNLLVAQAAFFLGYVAPSISQAVSISISSNTPSGAPTVSPSLVSLSLEQDRWLDWSGNLGSPNPLFYNALNNLYQITGQHVHIRIGADSEDHTNFRADIPDAQLDFPQWTATVPYPEAKNITVGQAYYNAVANLPSGTRVIWGVPLGLNNITAAYLEAQAILNAFQTPAVKGKGIVLDYIEIGNEGDLFNHNGARPKNYTVVDYTKEWIQFATNISTLPNFPKFLGAAFAESSHTTTGFSPQGIFANGILKSKPGALMTAISQHHYSGTFCFGNGGVLQDLMTKSTIRSNLTVFSPDIQATLSNGLVYYLGETNSYSCHGAPGVSNTAGAALWTLDYALYASLIGITRVHFHEGVGYKYSLIQPSTLYRSTLDGHDLNPPLAPHVQPQYYAAIIAGEAIGKSGSTQIAELTISDTRLAGYAFYEKGVLKRAVLINSVAYLKGNTAARGNKSVTFTYSGSAPSSLTIKRLTIGHADDGSGLTYGGQSYETSDATVSGTLQTTSQSATSAVVINDTEVVLVTFNA